MGDPYPYAAHAGRRTRQPPAARRAGRRRRKLVLFIGLGLASVMLGAAALAASGGLSRSQMITVHGTEQLVVNSYDGMSVQDAFPDITDGSAVIVIDPSGTVIARATLMASDPSSWGAQDAVYAFTVTVPTGEPRYGIEIGRNRGTAWFSMAQMRRGPALSLTG